ncbi:MAG TPA: carbon-nitrogen hydrolase family protein [Desulfobacterales bacterium]|nr:carbon-nitrogen hydrolase family protein [Desulfobacterales bacterium]
MCSLKIAVAQVPSKKGDIVENLATHLNAIEKAHSHDVSYLVFPELSLTGYEPELAAKLAFTPDDNRLLPLVESAKKNKMHIGVGAPLVAQGLPKIGLLIFSPDGSVETYAKMNVTPTEHKFFRLAEHITP